MGQRMCNYRVPVAGCLEVSKQTLREQVADKLAFMIQTGLLRPGDELPAERELAKTLNVSRESVRGAMAILAARGMVKVSHGSRSRVLQAMDRPLHELVGAMASLKDKDIEEVAVARAHFEVDVVRLAAVRMTEDTLLRLESLVIEQAGMLDDPVRFQISDREFHMTLYQACDNELMATVVSDFYYFALDVRRRALRRSGAIQHSVSDHHRIVGALKARDADAAVEAIRRHQTRVDSSTLDELKNHEQSDVV